MDRSRPIDVDATGELSAGQPDRSGTTGSDAPSTSSRATVADSNDERDDLVTQRMEPALQPDGGEILPPLGATEALGDDRPTRCIPAGAGFSSSDSPDHVLYETTDRDCNRPMAGAPMAFGSAEPTTIGRYRTERLLGKGTFGEVFLAYDSGSCSCRVAHLKVPFSSRIADPKDFEDFGPEARSSWLASIMEQLSRSMTSGGWETAVATLSRSTSTDPAWIGGCAMIGRHRRSWLAGSRRPRRPWVSRTPFR